MRRLILVLPLLASCAPAPSTWVLYPPTGKDCGAASLQSLLGQPLAALGARDSLRVIRPGQAVTMDYSETRLNAEVDAQGRIIALTCG